jgi:hypothetical protein
MEGQVIPVYVHSTTPKGNAPMFLSDLQSYHNFYVTWQNPHFSHIGSVGRRFLQNTGIHVHDYIVSQPG